MNVMKNPPKSICMKIYNLKHMCFGSVYAGLFIWILHFLYTVHSISSSDNSKAEICCQHLGLLYFLWLCAGENNNRSNKTLTLYKRQLDSEKKFFSSLIASPATFSRFIGISGE